MALKHVDDSAANLSGPPAPLQLTSPPEPLLHHPVMGISLALIVAAAAQLGVWLFNARLISASEPVGGPALPSSVLIASPVLFDALREIIDHSRPDRLPLERGIFGLFLILSLLSVSFWYFAVRAILGPIWALWTALLWSVHPVFAFLAQRPTPLTTVIVLVPLAWCLIMSWSVRPRRWLALTAGAVTGLATAVSPPAILVFILTTPIALLASAGQRGRWSGIVLMWLTFCLTAAGGLLLVHAKAEAPPIETMRKDLWATLDMADGSPMALAARTHLSTRSPTDPGSPLGFLWNQFRTAPRPTMTWLTRRAWRTLYTTGDHRFERPLFTLQLAWLIPAIWGAVVALRHPPWRWRALAAIGLPLAMWLAAAVAEPKCRNLASSGGVIVMLGLVGLADLYERAFGRRLTESDEA